MSPREQTTSAFYIFDATAVYESYYYTVLVFHYHKAVLSYKRNGYINIYDNSGRVYITRTKIG
jgi:hypothetical protein